MVSQPMIPSTRRPPRGTPSADARRYMRDWSIITVGELLMTIEPRSMRFIVAAFTGAEPAKVRMLRVSSDNGVIPASAATDELTTVILEPASSQQSYCFPFMITLTVGV